MLEKRNNKCEICGNYLNFDTLCVDHDHNVNDPYDDSVRGLLCNNCNLLIGHAKDDVIILENAIEYLKRTKMVL